MFGSLGTMELVVILVIALIVFGPRKLPELGRSIGKSLGEFKRASNDLRNTLDEEIHVEEGTRIAPTPPAPAPPAAPASSAPTPSAPAPPAAPTPAPGAPSDDPQHDTAGTV